MSLNTGGLRAATYLLFYHNLLYHDLRLVLNLKHAQKRVNQNNVNDTVTFTLCDWYHIVVFLYKEFNGIVFKI